MRLNLFKHWAIFSVPLLLVLGFVYFGIGSEQEIVDYFRDHSAANPDIAAFLKVITDWSNPAFYAFYGFMLIQAFRQKDFMAKRYVAILLAVQVVVAVLCVNFIKHTVGYPRPGQNWWPDPMTTKGTYHSLPSGHTTEIIGWSLPLAFRQYKTLLTACLGLLVALVGFSRIYLGWHHATDVFFGWLLGSFTGFATAIIAESSLFRKKA